MNAINFSELTYLKKGSAIQQKGFDAITSSLIMEKLSHYDPVLVGTLPLDIFIETSDLDILCYFENMDEFIQLLNEKFVDQSNFKLRTTTLGGIESVVANFDHDGFAFEIVGQPVPVRDQVAYRHMINEWRILEERGDSFKKQIIELKKSGMKTEPAFAKALGLQGDPYQAVLNC